jgi:hypothetical protein
MYNSFVHMTNHVNKPDPTMIHDERQSTVPTARAIRQARENWMQDFEALAAYANLGDTPDSWQKFRLGWPNFFSNSTSEAVQSSSNNLAESLYDSALDWDRFCSENSAKLPADIRSHYVPLLLWYRDLLRAVWKRSDPRGAALCALLGFHEQARRSGLDEIVPANVRLSGPSSLQPDPIANILPPGRPIVDPSIYAIRWQFGCQFQRALYSLMESFWLAMICPQCGKYFIAGKTAQKFCSTSCSGAKKASASLDFYYRRGRHLREKQRASEKKSTKWGN